MIIMRIWTTPFSFDHVRHLRSILDWFSFLQLRINLDNLVVDDGSKNLQTLDVHLDLPSPLSLTHSLT